MTPTKPVDLEAVEQELFSMYQAMVSGWSMGTEIENIIRDLKVHNMITEIERLRARVKELEDGNTHANI